MKKPVYEHSAERAADAHVKSISQYEQMYRRSIEDPCEFWSEIAGEFHWEEPINADTFLSYNFNVEKGPVFIKWLEGATTNVCYNLVDRNVNNGHGDTVAFYWEGNDPEDKSELTYKELLEEVSKFANVLKSRGVQKGDRVAIYMPMVLEIVISMLACTRIGALHSIVFAGFSKDSLAERISDCQAKVLITTDFAYRGEKLLRLKDIADAALERCKDLGHEVETCVTVRHLARLNAHACGEVNDSGLEVGWVQGRDVWWHEQMQHASHLCQPVWVGAEDPLFMLYTSGSTGKPKGVLHTTGGYLLFAATTHKYAFDYKPGDVYWCTADMGWITGHTYVLYGPLANGATSVIFEGPPFHPSNDRYWSIIEKYKVNQFYTAPTTVRSLMKFGDEPVKKHDLSSLKVLGSVGEPLNPEAWYWFYNVVGGGKCSISDTFFQTETGGHVITPLPGVTPMKPGSVALPFFGAIPQLLSEEGNLIEGEGEGYLVFKQPWPGIMRTLFGNHERFESVYFSRFPGYYCTGDGARRDADGYFWITGRLDDMLNVSGHLMATASVEALLTEHPSIAEAAVVARPHAIKGECLYCFVTPKQNVQCTEDLIKELKESVRNKIAAFAVPDVIQYAPVLPKNRSGKILRRILRKIAVNDKNVGDISTLLDESAVEALFENRPESENMEIKSR